MGKSWKRRCRKARAASAREAVDNILSTTASMAQTIEEVIDTMKVATVETPTVVEDPVVAEVPTAAQTAAYSTAAKPTRPTRKRRARKTTTTTTATTATTVNTTETTD